MSIIGLKSRVEHGQNFLKHQLRTLVTPSFEQVGPQQTGENFLLSLGGVEKTPNVSTLGNTASRTRGGDVIIQGATAAYFFDTFLGRRTA